MDKESLTTRIEGDPPGLKGGNITVRLYSYHRGVVGYGSTLPQRRPDNQTRT